MCDEQDKHLKWEGETPKQDFPLTIINFKYITTEVQPRLGRTLKVHYNNT